MTAPAAHVSPPLAAEPAASAPGARGGLVVLSRNGRPPLRLRATLVARAEAPEGEGEGRSAIVLSLWRRPTGEWLAAFPWPLPQGPAADVVQGKTLAEIEDAFDRRFAEPLPSPPVEGAGEATPAEVVARLVARVRCAAARRALRALVEEVLTETAKATA